MPREQRDSYSGVMRGYIDAIKPLAKTCEYCKINPATVRHHEKYEGATIHDIKSLCQSCNLKKENRFLT